MAKLQLKTEVSLNIEENGKVVKTFTVEYKALSNKQERSLGKQNKEVFALYGKSTKLEKRISLLENEIEAYKELDNFDKVVSVTNTLKKLYTKQEDLEDKFESLGGIDVLTEAAKSKFNLAISGADLEELAKWIDDNSDYATILDLFEQDVQAKRGN